MDERKRLILNAIIQDYIYSAEPVGSRTLVKRHRIGLSPATIRNEMADLEEMGYLQQPHTSAGRVPSPRGYRFYVNSIMEDYVLSPRDMKNLEGVVATLGMSFFHDSRQLAKLMAAVTQYFSLIAEPVVERQTIRHISIVPLSSSWATCVVVLSDGTVKHHRLSIPAGVRDEEILSLSQLANGVLAGVCLEDLDSKLKAKLAVSFHPSQELAAEIFYLVKDILRTTAQELVMDGAANLLGEPEFRDIEKVRELFRSLEENDQVLKLMEADVDRLKDLAVKIGPEIGLDSFTDCSLVVATFQLSNRKVTLGILGPSRMQYAKTIGFLRWFREYFRSGGS